jgi:hypothetical protein
MRPLSILQRCCPPKEDPADLQGEAAREYMRRDLEGMVVEIRVMAFQMEMLGSMLEDPEDGSPDDEANAGGMAADVDRTVMQEVDEMVGRLGVQKALDEVEADCAKKVAALLKTAQKGCEGLQEMSEAVGRDIAEINAQAGNDKAFLDHGHIMRLACVYDEMNANDNTLERRAPLGRLLYVRHLLRGKLTQS